MLHEKFAQEYQLTLHELGKMTILISLIKNKTIMIEAGLSHLVKSSPCSLCKLIIQQKQRYCIWLQQLLKRQICFPYSNHNSAWRTMSMQLVID